MTSKLLADITPLRTCPPFRRMLFGSAFSSIGTAMTTFSVALQIFLITHSSAAVGAVGLASAIPFIALGLLGGAVADAFDRRRLVIGAQSLLMCVSFGFAAQAFAGRGHLWLLYGLVAVQSLLSSVSGPARRTFMPRLLPPEQVRAGAALAMLSMHTSVIVGPLLAGLIIPLAGLKACYLIDAVSFVASMYGVFRLPPMRPEAAAARPGLRSVIDGLHHLFASRVLTGVLLADISATLLAMPVALFPQINAERFGGSPRTLGLISAGLAIGGVAGTVFSGPLRHIRRPGLGVAAAGAAWGAALAGFGLVHSLVLTLAMLMIAGVADVSSVVLRTTVIQLATPDVYRGRVSSAELVVGAGFPQLGNFRAGLVASATSPSISAASGGLAAVVGAGVIALSLPALIRYTPAEVSADRPAPQ